MEEYERSRRDRAFEGRAEAEAVSTMLSDVARKSVQAEKASDGEFIDRLVFFVSHMHRD